jgi:hypothetical protein
MIRAAPSHLIYTISDLPQLICIKKKPRTLPMVLSEKETTKKKKEQQRTKVKRAAVIEKNEILSTVVGKRTWVTSKSKKKAARGKNYCKSD